MPIQQQDSEFERRNQLLELKEAFLAKVKSIEEQLPVWIWLSIISQIAGAIIIIVLGLYFTSKTDLLLNGISTSLGTVIQYFGSNIALSNVKTLETKKVNLEFEIRQMEKVLARKDVNGITIPVDETSMVYFYDRERDININYIISLDLFSK